ncbi:MAG: glycosyl hydrolase [Saprospiraceae bacterium]|nr:MAG: glycosyl hydrolase [Saprospiraceae bacterium]
MNKYLSLLIWGILLLMLNACSPQVETTQPLHRKAQSIKDAFEENFRRTMDLELGYPPSERLLTALEQTRRMQKTFAESGNRSGIGEARWRERGPSNIGGRTRAILIDQNDPNRNKLWVGSVAGGLWKTDDASAGSPKWDKVDDYLDNMAIGAITQDPNDPQYIYFGTGEGYNNADAVPGLGLFRSSDGGENWEILNATINNNFRRTRTMMVHPVTSDVYAGTSQGLWRSTDHGDTWNQIMGFLPPNLFASDDIYDVLYTSNGYIYVSTAREVYRSMSGNVNDWEKMSLTESGFPSGLSRVELTVSESNPNVLYILGNENGGASQVYTSIDGGATWLPRSRPSHENNGGEFTNGQAWYDLEIEVDPFNPNHVIVGGVPIFRSLNGGLNWERFAIDMHVDQHKVVFDKEIEGRIYFGNDGGIFRSTLGSGLQVQNKNTGYNVTQFYACAIHPEAFTDYFLGGTQDNSSLQLKGFGIQTARNVRGGDGFLCHIDEDEPQYQMVSSQFGGYSLSTNGGSTFSDAADFNGGFLNPSDYDSESNIMYAQTGDGDFYRWKINTNVTELVNISGFSGGVSTIAVDPNTPNRVYFGTFNSGRIIMVDDAHTGDLVNGVQLIGITGTVSSIDIEVGNPNHLLATVSNYGAVSVWESNNGGQNWINSEGPSLPDMPVRWGIFNPRDATQAMIATEAGVWVTELLDGPSTVWIPPVQGIGTPLVRTDMLQVRRSDNIVLAATHGRGLFTTDVFADPTVRMTTDQVGYTQAPIKFIGELSYNADTYLWDFGDGDTGTGENETHFYDAVGEYPITFTINGDQSLTSSVKILPDRAAPYIPGANNYSGDFEGFTEQYAVETIQGSAFERGNSTVSGKEGTHSGENAFVLGLNEETYQPNSHSILYLPNFDLSQRGIYEFSFWTRFRLNNGFDGFRVEYSKNRGQSWAQLGTADDPNWYNFRNDNLDNVGFSQGASYFSGEKNGYVQYKLNISGLSGEGHVAFRFVFKASDSGNKRGVAIDDVEISKYDGELATKLLSFTGEYTTDTEITLSWLTQPEYFCSSFQLERSFNGRVFEEIESVLARGRTTSAMNSYNQTTLGQRPVIFYRMKVINRNEDIDYNYEFYSPTIVMKKDDEKPLEAISTYPNPFRDHFFLTFNEVLETDIAYDLFNEAGQFIAKGIIPAGDVFGEVQTGLLPSGVYILSLNLEGQEPQVFKLMGGM